MKRTVLFLCIQNSARSQMAEAILNYRGGDRFQAFSAGVRPAGEVHPLAVRAMTEAGYDMSGKHPKHMNEFTEKNVDFVITLCDRMKEECPVFPGQPVVAHWGLPDPADAEGTDDEKLQAFRKTMIEIAERVSLFLSLPMEKLDRLALEQQVRAIGEIGAAAD
jgi:protein-tyrosine-phosphatase